MGVAAYHRGNQVISRQIAAGQRRPEFQMMDDLNSLPKLPDAGMPFGPVRFSRGNKGWWAECPSTGYGFWYSTLREAVRRWRVSIREYTLKGEWIGYPVPADSSR